MMAERDVIHKLLGLTSGGMNDYHISLRITSWQEVRLP